MGERILQIEAKDGLVRYRALSSIKNGALTPADYAVLKDAYFLLKTPSARAALIETISAKQRDRDAILILQSLLAEEPDGELRAAVAGASDFRRLLAEDYARLSGHVERETDEAALRKLFLGASKTTGRFSWDFLLSGIRSNSLTVRRASLSALGEVAGLEESSILETLRTIQGTDANAEMRDLASRILKRVRENE